MTKRLQVLVDEHELTEIQAFAAAQRMTTADWVRQVLRSARQGSVAVTDRKLAALERAVRLNLAPAVDIDQMLDEIERGALAR
ncbi:MAG: antitoxin [Thermoanaerobaculia bacterium]|jgi:hypothetical protein|nr:antitoxin [Thermoanaerobaculia bacterium]